MKSFFWVNLYQIVKNKYNNFIYIIHKNQVDNSDNDEDSEIDEFIRKDDISNLMVDIN